MNHYTKFPVAIIFFQVFIVALSTGCLAQQKTKTIAPDKTNYRLVWADEFNSNSIDTGYWNFEKGGGIWGNNEQEYYQAANAGITNGNLLILAKKEGKQNFAYTSARMTTKGKKEFKYGKIEARIKMPAGQGLWPAFWMLGANIDAVDWPVCGEIDIMEHINIDSLIHGTLHWNNNGHVSFGGSVVSTPADYHVYAVEWNAGSIKWLVDGIVYKTASMATDIKGNAAFQKPFFILLNLAVGGDWPGQTVDNSKFPASMFIDYVRVYQ